MLKYYCFFLDIPIISSKYQKAIYHVSIMIYALYVCYYIVLHALKLAYLHCPNRRNVSVGVNVPCIGRASCT